MVITKNIGTQFIKISPSPKVESIIGKKLKAEYIKLKFGRRNLKINDIKIGNYIKIKLIINIKRLIMSK